MSTSSVPAETSGADHWLAALFAFGLLLVVLLVSGYAFTTASLPNEDEGKALAVFPPNWSEERGLAAVVRAGGRPVRPVWPGFAWVANGAEAGFVGRLKDAGAVLVLGDMPMGPILAGCHVNLSADMVRALMNRDGPRQPVRTTPIKTSGAPSPG